MVNKQKVAVFAIAPIGKDFIFIDYFDCQKHAEQWIVNFSDKGREYVILLVFVGKEYIYPD